MNFTEAVGLSYQYGSQTSIIERLNLFNRVAKSPKGDVAEIGSATGGTTILLSFAAEAVGKHVYSIDPYPEHLEGVAKCYDHGGMKHYKDLFKMTNDLFGGVEIIDNNMIIGTKI